MGTHASILSAIAVTLACLGCGEATSSEGVQTNRGQSDPSSSTGGTVGTPPDPDTKEPPPNIAGDASPPPPIDSGITTIGGGGNIPTADAGSTVDPSPSCWFEFLGQWVRCQESWDAREGGEWETLSECAAACLDGDACTTIIDYNWIDPALPCMSHEGQCTPLADGVSYEEDGAREYRKVCGTDPPPDAIFAFSDESGLVADPSLSCRYVAIGDYLSCEDDVPSTQAAVTGATLDECLQACDARPDCTAVKDWWLGGPTEFECALHLSSCDAPTQGDQTDGVARFFAKVCGG